MTSSIRTTVIKCLIAVGIVLVVFVYSVMRTPTLNPEQLREAGVFILPEPRTLQPFSLLRHDGQPFANQDLLGHWSFVFFGYTYCPDICPTTMSIMGQAKLLIDKSADQTLAAQFEGVLVTVDPERDTAAVLAPYVGAFSDEFVGVTGAKVAIAVLAKQLSVGFQKVPSSTSSEAGSYLVDHTSQIVLLNPDGEYHGFIRAPHKAETLFQIYQTLQATF